MDEWQALVLTDALGEVGPIWAAFEVGLVVGRQNGKGGIAEARELAGVELFGERLILHTAHELKTAEEARLRMEQICESSPDLDRQVKRVVRTNGKEAIEFKNGARIKYVARSKGSGRGFSGDLIVMDEAMFLAAESMAALLPTLSAAPNPQVWYMGSAGLPESTHLASLRDRALRGDDRSLAYLEWSVDDDADRDDPAEWAKANPAMGIRITEDFIRKERAALDDEDFDRERLGIWSSNKRSHVIDLTRWASLTDSKSQIKGDIAFSVDVTPDRANASIAVAGQRSDGLRHVEVVPHDSRGNFDQKGTAWVVPRMAELVKKWDSDTVMLDASGPAGSLIIPLQEAGIKVTPVSTREMGQACGAFYDHVTTEPARLRHLGQPQLAAALGAARKRMHSNDAWTWHRKDLTDISPLVAVTLALFGFDQQAAKPKRTGKAAFF